jgi:hypothetical protein
MAAAPGRPTRSRLAVLFAVAGVLGSTTSLDDALDGHDQAQRTRTRDMRGTRDLSEQPRGASGETESLTFIERGKRFRLSAGERQCISRQPLHLPKQCPPVGRGDKKEREHEREQGPRQ